jgi:hypothetical protein
MSDLGDLAAAWSDFEDEAGPLLQDALSQSAPFDTGELADSMTWEDRASDLTAGSRDARGPIAAYVTHGTGLWGPNASTYPIEPVTAQFLHFFTSDGGEVFTRHVDHTGSPANPFHIDAWESVADEVTTLFYDIMPEGATLAYMNPWRRAAQSGITI